LPSQAATGNRPSKSTRPTNKPPVKDDRATAPAASHGQIDFLGFISYIPISMLPVIFSPPTLPWFLEI
jgi:hypothetical protein